MDEFDITWTISGTGNVVNNRILHTDWMEWTPTVAGFSANPTYQNYYRIDNNSVYMAIVATAVGTSNATTFTMTLPITPITATNYTVWFGGARGQDNGAECSPVFRILNNSATMSFYKGPGNTAWTNTGNKLANGAGFYGL